MFRIGDVVASRNIHAGIYDALRRAYVNKRAAVQTPPLHLLVFYRSALVVS